MIETISSLLLKETVEPTSKDYSVFDIYHRLLCHRLARLLYRLAPADRHGRMLRLAINAYLDASESLCTREVRFSRDPL
jgi:hypothetical protein